MLRRWVYTAMAFSHYSNQVESKLDAEAKILAEVTRAEALESLIRRAADPRPVDAPITSNDLVGRSQSSAYFNLLYIRALQTGAKDWWNNLALAGVPVGRGHKIEYHHIFPKARVKNRFPAELVNSIANLGFLSALGNKRVSAKDPAKYLAGVDPGELEKQWVPPDPSLWNVDRFPEFCAARRELLADALNEMLELPRHTRAGVAGENVSGEPGSDEIVEEASDEDAWEE